VTTEAQYQTFQTGHVGLNVSDLARSTEFYQQVFGFEVMSESREGAQKFAFLADGQKKLVLTLWEQSQDRFNRHLPGLHHLSFQVANLDEVKAVEVRLRELQTPLLYDGIVPHAEGAPSGGIFFEDPDGIRLEIYAPTGAGDYAAPTPGAPSCGFF
jgi:lactoylglutathione lyase